MSVYEHQLKFDTPTNDQTRSKEITRDKHTRPLSEECLTQNVVYRAIVESLKGKEIYIGLAANQFKTRFRNNTASFRNENIRNATESSKHI